MVLVEVAPPLEVEHQETQEVQVLLGVSGTVVLMDLVVEEEEETRVLVGQEVSGAQVLVEQIMLRLVVLEPMV